MSSFPVPDTSAATVLGSALRAAGYSESGVHQSLGDDAYSIVEEDVLSEERRLAGGRLGVAVRLCFLQRPVAV